MNFKTLLNKLKNLNMPIDQYVIFGSGPMAIRDLRDCSDIDILVTDELWNKLKQKYRVIENYKIIIDDDIEIFSHWKPWLENKNEIIDNSEIIDNLPFVSLKYLLQWKKLMNRPKDNKDIKIIYEYLKPQIKTGLYKHYKNSNNTTYLVLGLVIQSETLDPLVIYQAQSNDNDNPIWARPIELFLDKIKVNGKIVKRFEPI